MKHRGWMILLILLSTACRSSKTDSVAWTKKENAAKGVDVEVADFLTEALDASMMELAQARLAKERGTTQAVREYAELLMNDQTRLLNEIKTIAASKKIEVPSATSTEKENALQKLRKQQGKKFDKEFIDMMIRDHRSQVNAFKRAAASEDGDVSTLSKNFLPVIRSHLEKIQAIEDK